MTTTTTPHWERKAGSILIAGTDEQIAVVTAKNGSHRWIGNLMAAAPEMEEALEAVSQWLDGKRSNGIADLRLIVGRALRRAGRTK